MERIKAWPPVRYTPPLTPGDDGLPKYSDGYKLLKFVDTAYRLPDGSRVVLENWQRSLIISVLETYPPGHDQAGELRFRQVLVSVGRQNGKSVIGAIMVLYGLFRENGALVLGLASNALQAEIVYERVLTALQSEPSLAKNFKRATKKNGIETLGNSRYVVRAAKSTAVQGLDIRLGIGDELHIMPKDLWSDMVSGLGGRANGLVFGITTAGDENSILLKHLYRLAETGEAGEIFGHFIWEAPDNQLPEDPDEFARYVMLANPSTAEGRVRLATKVAEVKSNPLPDQIRYNMNRFTAATAAFIRLDLWDGLKSPELLSETPTDASAPVIALACSPEKTHATIVAAYVADGVTYTEVVAGVQDFRARDLVRLCEQLWGASPAKYVIARNGLYAVAKDLIELGYPVEIAGNGDEIQASSHFYSLIAQKRLRHDGNDILYYQLPRTIRKNVGDKFRISGPDSSTEVDAVYATAFACLYAEMEQESNSIPLTV